MDPTIPWSSPHRLSLSLHTLPNSFLQNSIFYPNPHFFFTYNLSLSLHGVVGVRHGHGSSSGVQGRRGGGAPKSGLNLRHLRDERGGDVVAGASGRDLPREAALRQGHSRDQVFRGGGDSLDLAGPRAPRRVRRTRRLPCGVPPPLEGLPLRGARDARGRSSGAAGGPRGELARGARAVRAGGGAGEGVGARRRVPWRRRRG